MQTSGPSQVNVALMIFFLLSLITDHSRYSSWPSRLASAASQRCSSELLCLITSYIELLISNQQEQVCELLYLGIHSM